MITARTTRLGALAVILAAQATAQTGEPEPVDAMIADVGVLSESLRSVDVGLQAPSAFNQVYRVPGPSAKFMRVDGALYAVFDESVYAKGKQGVLPVIPNNTVFYIGEPDFEAMGQTREVSATTKRYPGRIDARLAPPIFSTRLGNVPTPRLPQLDAEMVEATKHTAGRIVWDTRYREQRLRTLMEYAARRAATQTQ